jgi:hypothetical protein
MANNPPFLDSEIYSALIGDVLKQLFEKHWIKHETFKHDIGYKYPTETCSS